MARANPERTLDAVLNAQDRADAIKRLTAALRRTWAAGHDAGWRDGVSDITDDEPKRTPNPYPTGEGERVVNPFRRDDGTCGRSFRSGSGRSYECVLPIHGPDVRHSAIDTRPVLSRESRSRAIDAALDAWAEGMAEELDGRRPTPHEREIAFKHAERTVDAVLSCLPIKLTKVE